MTGEVYLLPVWDTIKAAWEKVYGAKASIWAAYGLVLLVMIAAGILAGLFKAMLPGSEIIINILSAFITYFMMVGIIYIGINRAFDLSVSYRLMFQAFKPAVMVNIVFLYILIMLILLPFGLLFALLGAATGAIQGNQIVINGFFPGLIALLLVCGIVYVSCRLYPSLCILLDKKVSALTAIKLSWQATRKNFWRIFAIWILEILIIIVGMIPLGIGIIWTYPFIYVCFGMVYKRLVVNMSI